KRGERLTLEAMAVLTSAEADTRGDRPRASVRQVDHALDRAARFRGERRIDRHLVAPVAPGEVDVLQADALHVRAQAARPDELDVGRLDGHVGGHRAFGDEGDLLWAVGL